MAITGAIFDCDGTLVDSMPMWDHLVYDLLEAHGFPKDEWVVSVVSKYEPLSVPDECEALSRALGTDASGAELFDELRELVRRGYVEEVRPYAGVADFLESLADAGIPMVVASSTGASEVDLCLRTHGLRGFFSDIISAEELGLTKEEPDIYYLAQNRLGTELDSTWVFEDTPFGLATSRRAGFPNVCVFNGHDGRDADVLRESCTLFTHEYEDVSLDLLRKTSR